MFTLFIYYEIVLQHTLCHYIMPLNQNMQNRPRPIVAAMPNGRNGAVRLVKITIKITQARTSRCVRLR